MGILLVVPHPGVALTVLDKVARFSAHGCAILYMPFSPSSISWVVKGNLPDKDKVEEKHLRYREMVMRGERRVEHDLDFVINSLHYLRNAYPCIIVVDTCILHVIHHVQDIVENIVIVPHVEKKFTLLQHGKKKSDIVLQHFYGEAYGDFNLNVSKILGVDTRNVRGVKQVFDKVHICDVESL